MHVLDAVDRDRYDVRAIGITREGRWIDSGDAIGALPPGAKALPSPDDSDAPELDPLPAVSAPGEVVVFPLLHGPMGEDGTVQGMLELAGIPYVGAGVLASALAMDKAVAKEVFAHNGIAQPRWLSVRERDIDDAFVARIERELGLPAFVKPANLGSSVGVTKAHDVGELRAALTEAVRFDEYVVVEEAIAGREIEVAVLGNDDPEASLPGEIVPGNEFYDFDDKYVNGASGLLVPAPLTDAQVSEVQAIAVRAYKALRVDGMARVDFFFEEGDRGFLVNEINTIPGFTEISMYPKLWEASGVPYRELVDRLVDLAVERHARRSRFDTKR